MVCRDTETDRHAEAEKRLQGPPTTKINIISCNSVVLEAVYYTVHCKKKKCVRVALSVPRPGDGLRGIPYRP